MLIILNNYISNTIFLKFICWVTLVAFNHQNFILLCLFLLDLKRHSALQTESLYQPKGYYFIPVYNYAQSALCLFGEDYQSCKLPLYPISIHLPEFLRLKKTLKAMNKTCYLLKG